MLGMSERNVQLLVKSKILPRADHGKYDLFCVAKAYIKHLNDKLGGKIIEPEQDDLKGRKLKAETEEKEAKAALRQIQLKEEQGKLFRREEVMQQWSSRLIEVRSALLDLPQHIAFRFSDPDIKILVEEECYAGVIEALKRYSRDGFAQSADNTLGSENIQNDNGTSTVNNGKRMGGQKTNTRNKR